MKRPDDNERLVWIVCGMLLAAYLVLMLTPIGGQTLLHAWASFSFESDPNMFGPADYRILWEMSLLLLCALGLSSLFYWFGLHELRQRNAMERQYRETLEEAYSGTVQALTTALDMRDDETYGHSRRVTGYSLAIGKRLGLSDHDLQTLAWGALLHDLGKIGIRDQILLKPGPLTEAERAAMNQHVVIGHQLVESVPFLARTAAMIRHHHERYDGTGYPDGLLGQEIPLLARIFAVVDSFDAMTSSRPYRRQPKPMAEAVRIIREEAGRQFCPAVVAVFEQVPAAELEAVRAASFGPINAMELLVGPGANPEQPDRQAGQDLLTRTRSLAAWDARLGSSAAMKGGALGTVVTINLDRFRAVNEEHGQATGDRILADLGARLRQVCSDVYRVSGDEFRLWYATDEWLAGQTRLAALLAHFTDYWGKVVPGLTVSWGVQSATDDTKSLSDLAERAGRAMRLHKAARQGEAV